MTIEGDVLTVLRSPLTFQYELLDNEALYRLICLHGYGHTSEQLMPLVRSLRGIYECYALTASRPVMSRPYLANKMAQTWYIAREFFTPEPATFGDSLIHVEQFLLGLLNQDSECSRPLCLLGIDQGAVIALSLGSVWPERIGGVIAIQGCLPEIVNMPEYPWGDAVPRAVLLIGDPAAAGYDRVAITATRLAASTCQVTFMDVWGVQTAPSMAQASINAWLADL